jgi:hypothetical protein
MSAARAPVCVGEPLLFQVRARRLVLPELSNECRCPLVREREAAVRWFLGPRVLSARE